MMYIPRDRDLSVHPFLGATHSSYYIVSEVRLLTVDQFGSLILVQQLIMFFSKAAGAGVEILSMCSLQGNKGALGVKAPNYIKME